MIEIYTDGSCLRNPGVMGFGAIILLPTQTVEVYGGMPHGTNQVAELWAAVHALRWMNEVWLKRAEIELFSDSRYLINGMTVWADNWIKGGWKKELAHKKTWKLLHKLQAKHDVTWTWIKGHNGNTYNVKADRLAGQSAELTKEREWVQVFYRRK